MMIQRLCANVVYALGVLVVVALLGLLVGCTMQSAGTLVLALDESLYNTQGRSITVDEISDEISRFVVSLSHATAGTVTVESSKPRGEARLRGTSVVVDGLSRGTWTITVAAYNADDVQVGYLGKNADLENRREKQVTIARAQVTQVQVTVVPLDDYQDGQDTLTYRGDLQVAIDWSTVSANLAPADSQARLRLVSLNGDLNHYSTPAGTEVVTLGGDTSGTTTVAALEGNDQVAYTSEAWWGIVSDSVTDGQWSVILAGLPVGRYEATIGVYGSGGKIWQGVAFVRVGSTGTGDQTDYASIAVSLSDAVVQSGSAGLIITEDMGDALEMDLAVAWGQRNILIVDGDATVLVDKEAQVSTTFEDADSYTWYVDGIAQSGAATSSFALTPEDIGVYTVILSILDDGSWGCASVDLHVVEPLTVSYGSNGGSAVESTSDIITGDTIEAPVDPERTGYAFGGWYADEACETPWVFATDTVDEDMTLYAKWIALYDVSFESNEGSAVDTIVDVLDGSTINAPADPIRTGYAFGGWYADEAFQTVWIFATDAVEQDTTLYAKWTANQYTVTLDNQEGIGGTASATATYDAEMPTIDMTAPTRSGYSFGGYWDAEGGTGTQYYDDDMASAHLWDKVEATTLYAKWRGYIVNFISNGGSAVADIEDVVHGTKIAAPAASTKAGNGLVGWYTESTLENIWEFDTDTVAQDITLYAKWQDAYAVKDIGPAGGYIFHDKGLVSDGWRYLEAAPACTEENGKVWGGYDTLVDGTGNEIGTGEGNTGQIVESYGDAEPYEKRSDYAAKLCADLEVTAAVALYDDWFLPSKIELSLLHDVLYSESIGGFSYDFYWSSSEYSSYCAWGQSLSESFQIINDKFSSGRIRAVRAF